MWYVKCVNATYTLGSICKEALTHLFFFFALSILLLEFHENIANSLYERKRWFLCSFKISKLSLGIITSAVMQGWRHAGRITCSMFIHCSCYHCVYAVLAYVCAYEAVCVMCRWLIMVLLLSWMMVLFVLVMFALTKATRCLLVVWVSTLMHLLEIYNNSFSALTLLAGS